MFTQSFLAVRVTDSTSNRKLALLALLGQHLLDIKIFFSLL